MKNENIIFGSEKGREYSQITREVQDSFNAWLAFAGIDEKEFHLRMQQRPYRIEQKKFENGDVSISIFAGNQEVIVPLIFSKGSGDKYEDFLVNAMLLLSFIAFQHGNRDFELELQHFWKINK